MTVTEVGGTLSTFGDQAVSQRLTETRTKFPKGGRTDKLYDKCSERHLLGTTSPGAIYAVNSSLGTQLHSKKATFPAYKIGSKYKSDTNFMKEYRPGPGTYESTQAFGKQQLSKKQTETAWKVGTSQRWGSEGKELKPDSSEGNQGEIKPTSGWLGDSPNFSFSNMAKRYELGKGLPGWNPTIRETPSPFAYDPKSSFGNQVISTKESFPQERIGTMTRDKFSKQYISRGHARALYGTFSPGPTQVGQISSIGQQLTSQRKTEGSTKFSRGDRFSEVKFKDRITPAVTPGPGSYVV